ncbi:MAG: DUF4286 family protein [Phycisphaerales bacterium]|nr:DUF4286 family protein [Phycisphaerales bacterium]
MSAIVYTVTATLPDRPTAERYLDWLRDGHVDAVVAAGAHSAMIVRVTDPPDPIRVETRYVFPTRQALDDYLANHAPALRAEGAERFGPETGVRFARTVGEVV